MIAAAGEQGLTYEQLLARTRSQAAAHHKKLYFPSYNCRKLVRLGLISAHQKIDKRSRSWATANTLRRYADFRQENLLAKGAGTQAPTETRGKTPLSACEYEPRLTWDQNILRAFVRRRGSLTVKELLARLGAESRHRFLKRYINKFVAAGVLRAVTLTAGKSFYKKFTLSKAFIATHPKLVSAYAPGAVPRRLRPTSGPSSVASAAVRMARRAVFDASETHTRALAVPVLRRVATLLRDSPAAVVREAAAARCLDPLVQAVLEGRTTAISAADLLFTSSALFACVMAHRYALTGQQPPASTKNEQKLQSRDRLEKMVFILNALSEQKQLTLHQLVQLINGQFGGSGEPRVDRKTVGRMAEELHRLGLLRIRRFLVDFGPADSELALDGPSLALNKVFVLDPEHAVGDDELTASAYVMAPFFRGEAVGAQREEALHFPQMLEVEARMQRAQRLVAFFDARHQRHRLGFLVKLVRHCCEARLADIVRPAINFKEERICVPLLDELVGACATGQELFAMQECYDFPTAFYAMPELLRCLREEASVAVKSAKVIIKSLSHGFPVALEEITGLPRAAQRLTANMITSLLVQGRKARLGTLNGHIVVKANL